MRKDVRYGLGIGALALVFLVTYFIVRHHAEKQVPDGPQSASADGGADGGASPEANPTQLGQAGDGPATNQGVSLPPIPPGPGGPPLMSSAQRGGGGGGATGNAGVTPPPADPFAERAPGPKKPKPTQDWDYIMANGHVPGSAGGPGGRASRPPVTPPKPSAQQSSGSLLSQGTVTPRQPPIGRLPDGTGVSPRPIVGGGTVSASTGRPYTIRDNDTFVSIAKATYGSSKYFQQIERANPGVNPNRLHAGQVIVLPDLSPAARAAKAPDGPFPVSSDNRAINPKTEYRVDTGDSLFRISQKVYGTHRMMDAIYDANRQAIGPDPEKLRFGMILKLPQLAGAEK
ncbi:MAG TPA: LysM domain-containing protein [Humisphaera sp.]